MPCHYCEKHLNLLLLSSANVRTIELKRSEQKHVTAAFQHKIFIFTTSRTKSVRLSVLQDILSISVLLIQRQQKFQMTLFFFLPPSPKLQNFWFSTRNCVPEQCLQSAVLALPYEGSPRASAWLPAGSGLTSHAPPGWWYANKPGGWVRWFGKLCFWMKRSDRYAGINPG